MQIIDIDEIWDSYKDKDELPKESEVPDFIIDKINSLIDQPDNNLVGMSRRAVAIQSNGESRIIIFNEKANNATIDHTTGYICINVNKKIYNFIVESSFIPRIPYNLFRYARDSDKYAIEARLDEINRYY